jgi:GGDEF domain-containing protein
MYLYAKEMSKREYKTQTEIDPLTQLPNYRGSQQIFDQLIEREKPFGVFMIDVDGFGELNNNPRYGYEVTNDLLRQFGVLLRNTLYHGHGEHRDDIVTRLDSEQKRKPQKGMATRKHGEHGDEFLCFLPSVEDEKQLQIVLKKIVLAFNEAPFYVERNGEVLEIPVTVSVGGGIYRDGQDRVAFLEHIEKNGVRAAKNEGKNKFVIASSPKRRRTRATNSQLSA